MKPTERFNRDCSAAVKKEMDLLRRIHGDQAAEAANIACKLILQRWEALRVASLDMPAESAWLDVSLLCEDVLGWVIAEYSAMWPDFPKMVDVMVETVRPYYKRAVGA